MSRRRALDLHKTSGCPILPRIIAQGWASTNFDRLFQEPAAPGIADSFPDEEALKP
jgi:hypothetical protein